MASEPSLASPCKRLLVTGATGFVGSRFKCLAESARAHWAESWVFATRQPLGGDLPDDWRADESWIHFDLSDARATERAVRDCEPSHVLHLAALAHPRSAEIQPDLAEGINAEGTAAVARGASAVKSRMLLASTAQVYGRRGGCLRESDRPAPANAYGRSKLLAEKRLLEFADSGLETLIARPFNHSGRGQSADYVLPAFASEIRRALAEGTPARTGNLEPRRDFLHVDDVLEGYRLLLQRAPAGTLANVCSGIGTPIAELFNGLAQRLGLPSDQRVTDPLRVRGDDPPEIIGDASRLKALGWEPQHSLDSLLDEVAGL